MRDHIVWDILNKDVYSIETVSELEILYDNIVAIIRGTSALIPSEKAHILYKSIIDYPIQTMEILSYMQSPCNKCMTLDIESLDDIPIGTQGGKNFTIKRE